MNKLRRAKLDWISRFLVNNNLNFNVTHTKLSNGVRRFGILLTSQMNHFNSFIHFE